MCLTRSRSISQASAIFTASMTDIVQSLNCRAQLRVICVKGNSPFRVSMIHNFQIGHAFVPTHLRYLCGPPFGPRPHCSFLDQLRESDLWRRWWAGPGRSGGANLDVWPSGFGSADFPLGALAWWKGRGHRSIRGHLRGANQ